MRVKRDTKHTYSPGIFCLRVVDCVRPSRVTSINTYVDARAHADEMVEDETSWRVIEQKNQTSSIYPWVFPIPNTLISFDYPGFWIGIFFSKHLYILYRLEQICQHRWFVFVTSFLFSLLSTVTDFLLAPALVLDEKACRESTLITFWSLDKLIHVFHFGDLENHRSLLSTLSIVTFVQG